MFKTWMAPKNPEVAEKIASEIVTYPIPPETEKAVGELHPDDIDKLAHRVLHLLGVNANKVFEGTEVTGIQKGVMKKMILMETAQENHIKIAYATSKTIDRIAVELATAFARGFETAKMLAAVSKTVGSIDSVVHENQHDIGQLSEMVADQYKILGELSALVKSMDKNMLTKEFMDTALLNERERLGPAVVATDTGPAKHVTKNRKRSYGAKSNVPTRKLNDKEVTVLKRLLIAGYSEAWIATHLNISCVKVIKIGYGGSYAHVLPYLTKLTLAACAPLVRTPKISYEHICKFVRVARITHHEIALSRTDMVVLKGMVVGGSPNAEIAGVFDLPRQRIHDRIVATAIQKIGKDCPALHEPYYTNHLGHTRLKLDNDRIAAYELGLE